MAWCHVFRSWFCSVHQCLINKSIGMSDFLTRLAQRSMGAAPLIAPRLPSLFAPTEESPIGSAADATAVTDAVQSKTFAPPSLQSTPTGRIDSATTASAADELHASDYQPQRATATEAITAARTTTATASIESTLIPLVKATQANFQTTAPLTADTPQVASPLESATAARTPDKTAAAPEHLLPLLPQRRSESAAPFAVSADTALAADSGASVAPTVHITIGRVEVRANIAAAPPAAPRPRPTSQPALSLNDYLKRGAGAS